MLRGVGNATVGEVLERLGERAPFGKAAGWDPVGLQIGDPAAPVATLALCHEVTDAVIAAVEEAPVDLLISYHPLIFRPLPSLVAGAGPQGRAWRLARRGVALGVVHTAFDVAQGGTSDALAEALDLVNVRGFGPLHGSDSVKIVTFVPPESADAVLDDVVAAGGGRIGNYTHCSFRTEGSGTFFAGRGTDPVKGAPGSLNREAEMRLEFVAPRAREDAILAALIAAHPYEEPAYDVFDRRGDAGMVGRVGDLESSQTLSELAQRVAEALDDPVLRLAGAPERQVHRVAVLPGAGGDFLGQAASAGADVMVTGDLTHHRVREALDRGLCAIDPGHAPTERPGLHALFAILATLGPECRSLLELDPDPWGLA